MLFQSLSCVLTLHPLSSLSLSRSFPFLISLALLPISFPVLSPFLISLLQSLTRQSPPLSPSTSRTFSSFPLSFFSIYFPFSLSLPIYFPAGSLFPFYFRSLSDASNRLSLSFPIYFPVLSLFSPSLSCYLSPIYSMRALSPSTSPVCYWTFQDIWTIQSTPSSSLFGQMVLSSNGRFLCPVHVSQP